MYKYIIVFCLCVSLTSVLSQYLNKREGEACEWEGLAGKCVQEKRCLTTIDDESPKHPVCTKKLGKKIICCTDCEIVNNTENAILTPSGLFWRNGQTPRDTCLQYLVDLPYRCKGNDFFAGITRELDENNKCYRYTEWDTDSSDDSEPKPEFPHHALLGYGEDLGTASWPAGGVIISDKFILTAASYNLMYNRIKFVALGVTKLSNSPADWQTHTVKRFIPHPDFQLPDVHNDIALIETEKTITFNRNVLPACLHVEASDDETALTTTWRKQETESYYTMIADNIQPIVYAESSIISSLGAGLPRLGRAPPCPQLLTEAIGVILSGRGETEWDAIASYCESVMRAKEEAEHVKETTASTSRPSHSGRRTQQWTSQYDLRPPYGRACYTASKIKLNKFTEKECKNAYVLPQSLEMKFEFNSVTQMCYGNKTGSTDACKGLTGEPLVISSQFSNCIYTVIGLLSFGRICENVDRPSGVYTKVTPFIPWIESIVWP